MAVGDPRDMAFNGKYYSSNMEYEKIATAVKEEILKNLRIDVSQSRAFNRVTIELCYGNEIICSEEIYIPD